MLLIGSRALHYWFPEYRTPRDWDILINTQDLLDFIEGHRDEIKCLDQSSEGKYMGVMKTGERLEFEICDNKVLEHGKGACSANLINRCNQDGPLTDVFGMMMPIARPSTLLLLKESHIWLPVHFEKHIRDLHFLRGKVTEYSEAEEDALVVRITETNQLYPFKNATMNISNHEFFEQSERAVKRKYQHDAIHYATCYYDEPLFLRCKKDKSKAKMRISLFLKLSEDDRIKCIREEAFVIAIERKLINYTDPPDELIDDAYAWAVGRICTTLFGGWFRAFAINNWPKIRECEVKFYDKFRQNIGRFCT